MDGVYWLLQRKEGVALEGFLIERCAAFISKKKGTQLQGIIIF